MKSKKLESKSKISSKGKLLVVSGPSGVGKGTIVKELLSRRPDIKLSISATTRLPRPDEKDGVSYRFISDESFRQLIDKGELLEYDRHFDHFYGTPSDFVYENLCLGNDVLLEIDISGALQVKNKYPLAQLFFIEAPSIEELHRRLTARNSETEEDIQKRLERVEKEMEYEDYYDYIIVNDTVDNAVNKILQILEEE